MGAVKNPLEGLLGITLCAFPPSEDNGRNGAVIAGSLESGYTLSSC